ncbi:hypothetical protein [Paraurantiacibacter namhicola]|uniref:Lipoprotein n=1 Tax=Paraurantiacibacter namhicola TaxID=645517 RepID=A0A1C7D6S5_9SPHN|nr:hypothetical protein [Paraurantiacibacter namhicola]ANU07031.1 hypothetical protein A6F65_00710 [Paraurantiacibacter namhicola]
MRATILTMLSALVAACASVPDTAPLPSVVQLEAEAESPAEFGAALLATAEAAGDEATRAPYLARLNGLGVQVAEGESDDPLAAWRAADTSTSTPWRGRTLGPAYRRARLAPGESMEMEQVFYAGQKAEIAAHASKGARVELTISDRDTKRVCARSLSPKAKCLWLPRFTERFAITLTNRGERPASVFIVVR